VGVTVDVAVFGGGNVISVPVGVGVGVLVGVVVAVFVRVGVTVGVLLGTNVPVGVVVWVKVTVGVWNEPITRLPSCPGNSALKSVRSKKLYLVSNVNVSGSPVTLVTVKVKKVPDVPDATEVPLGNTHPSQSTVASVKRTVSAPAKIPAHCGLLMGVCAESCRITAWAAISPGVSPFTTRAMVAFWPAARFTEVGLKPICVGAEKLETSWTSARIRGMNKSFITHQE